MTTKTDTKTSSLIINELTKDQYTKALEEGQINEDELYLVAGEEYTKEEVDSLLNLKQNKLTAGANIVIDEITNTISSTGGDTSLCVHLEGYEIISGVKEFTGGSGGSSTDVSLQTKNAIAIGDETQTNYTGVYVHRKCTNDGNKVNTAGFLVNSDGSAKFTHKKGTTTEASGFDDSYIRFDQTSLVYSTSQNTTDEKDILHEGNVKTINGKSIKGSGDITISSSFSEIIGEPTDNANLKNALDSKQDAIEDLDTIRSGAELGSTALQSYIETDPVYLADKPSIALKTEIPSLEGYATENYVQNYHDSTKQDTINDLEQIRTNAQTGADIVPQVNSNTQRIEELTTAKMPNATPIGTPKIIGSYVSNFSDSNYMLFPLTDVSHGLPFDMYFSFTTDDDVITQQNIIDSYFGMAIAIKDAKGLMAISSNGTNWDIGVATGTNTILPNTTYYAKCSWTGTNYSTALSTDEQSFSPDMNLPSTLSPHKTTIYIGGSPNIFGAGSAHPFKGTINFKGARVIVKDLEVWDGYADVGFQTRADVSFSNIDDTAKAMFTKGNTAYDTIQGYGDIVTHNAIEFALKSEIPDISNLALNNSVVHLTGLETITGQKVFKLNNTYANNTLDAIFANGIFIGDGMSTTTSRLFNTRWCNNSFQIKTSQDIGYSYLASSNSNNYGLKYQVQRMPSRSSYPTSAGVVEAGMVLSYDGLIVGYSEQANKKVNDNEFIYVLDQKNVKTKTIDTLATTDKTIIGAINELNTKTTLEYYKETTSETSKEAKISIKNANNEESLVALTEDSYGHELHIRNTNYVEEAYGYVTNGIHMYPTHLTIEGGYYTDMRGPVNFDNVVQFEGSVDFSRAGSVSGLKTIDNNSLVGSGNINVTPRFIAETKTLVFGE